MSLRFTKIVSDIRAILDFQGKFDFDVVAVDRSTMTNIANAAASSLKRVQLYLPSLNSEMANSISSSNLVVNVKAMTRSYTGLAQALEDRAISLKRASRELKKFNGDLATLAANIDRGSNEPPEVDRRHDDMEPTGEDIYDAPSDQGCYDIVKNVYPARPVPPTPRQQTLDTMTHDAPLDLSGLTPESLDKLEDLSTSVSNMSLSSLMETAKMANSDVKKVLASKHGVVIKDFADLSKYMDQIRDAEKDVSDAQKIRDMVRKSLDRGRTVDHEPAKPVVVPRSSPMTPGENRERIDRAYKDKLSKLIGKNDSYRQMMRDADDATVALMKRMASSLRKLPKSLPKGLEWAPVKAPVWVHMAKGGLTESAFKRVGIKAIPYDFGWILEDQLVIMLPAADIKMRRDAWAKLVDGISKAIDARSDTHFIIINPNKPFTSGGVRGFIYLWMFPENVRNALQHFSPSQIGFPTDLGTKEVSDLSERRQASQREKETDERYKESLNKIDMLRSAKTEAEKLIEADLATFDADIDKLKSLIETLKGELEVANVHKDAMVTRINQIQEELARSTNSKTNAALEIELSKIMRQSEAMMAKAKDISKLRTMMHDVKVKKDDLIRRAREAALSRMRGKSEKR